MAQKRFTNYKDPVESFPLGYQNVGLTKPGRYNGFDEFSITDNTTVSLNHSGAIKKTSKNNTLENNFGAIIMPNGTIIHDDNTVLLNIPENTASQTNMYHLVVCEHIYQEVVGGTVATYTVVAGTTEGVKPDIPDPATQVLVGTINTRTGASSSTGLTEILYEVAKAPLPGDLTYEQVFNNIEGFLSQLNNQTGQNVGSGVTVYRSMSTDGKKLQFKSLKSSDGSIGIESVTSNNEVDLKAKASISNTKYVSEAEVDAAAGKYTLIAEDWGKLIRIQTNKQVDIHLNEGLPVGFYAMFYRAPIFLNPAAGMNDASRVGVNTTLNLLPQGQVEVSALWGDNTVPSFHNMCLVQSMGVADKYDFISSGLESA